MQGVPWLGFDADLIIHGSANPLPISEMTFRYLHGSVPQQESNLVQFSPAEWHSFAHERLRSCGAVR